MKIDLLHNKIVSECATDAFKEQIEAAIREQLSGKEEEILGVQMYDDCLSRRFYDGKTFYYPLSVKTAEGVFAKWVCWTVKRGAFAGDNPFAFVGKGEIGFIFPDFVPSEFTDGYVAAYGEGGGAKIRIEAPVADYGVLSGKYSQKFIDLLAKRLAPIVEDAAAVRGIEEGRIEFAVVFSPETYMEHTSENVTYRRLLLCDSGSAPRDLWIKWTRLDGTRAYSMADEPDPENIVFELGEDVPQKIKEKEYRFLSMAGKDKYHNAMGRKHITEWREVIKRAVKRGELIKADAPATEVARAASVIKTKPQTADVSTPAIDTSAQMPEVAANTEFSADEDGLENSSSVFDAPEKDDEELALDAILKQAAAVAEGYGERSEEELPAREPAYATSGAAVITDESFLPADDEELARAMKMAQLALDSMDEDEEGESEEEDELQAFYAEDEAPSSPLTSAPLDEDEEREVDELTRMALEALALARVESAGKAEEEPEAEDGGEELAEEIELDKEAEDELDFENPEVLDEEAEDELDGEVELAPENDGGFVPMIVPEDPTEEEYSDEEYDEEALADVRALEPDEEAATKNPAAVSSAEPIDIAKIREEIEAKVRLEYESLARMRAEEEAARLRREQEQLRMENERLLERARREEAQRQLAEENHKNEKAELRAQIEASLRREAKEKERLVEAARIAAAEQQALELEKMRAERARLEDERARREAEERAAAEKLAEEKRLEEERQRAEAEATAQKQTATRARNYTFTTKSVSLIFRKSVDPNLISRIEATIKATLEYLGKQDVPMKIKATIPTSNMVKLEFREFPEQELELLGSIVKIMGNNNLGIAKAIIE